jgi:VanZ family protein
MRRLAEWVPAIAWAALIWFFSTETFTAQSTAGFVLPFLSWLLPHASPQTLEQLHFLIRKAGHFGEYFVFALLVFRGVCGGRPGWNAHWAWSTILIVTGYATLDEFHQSFVPSRGASLADVALDTFGGAAAVLLFWRRQQSKMQTDGIGNAERNNP